jgi:hypothetical protein
VTFNFTAVGRPDDVVRQIRSHHATDDQLAVKVRDLITDAIAAHSAADDCWPGGGGWAYIVKANGYSGHHSSVMVSLSIEPLYIPGIVPAEALLPVERLGTYLPTTPGTDSEDLAGLGEPAVDGEPVLDPQRDY